MIRNGQRRRAGAGVHHRLDPPADAAGRRRVRQRRRVAADAGGGPDRRRPRRHDERRLTPRSERGRSASGSHAPGRSLSLPRTMMPAIRPDSWWVRRTCIVRKAVGVAVATGWDSSPRAQRAARRSPAGLSARVVQIGGAEPERYDGAGTRPGRPSGWPCRSVRSAMCSNAASSRISGAPAGAPSGTAAGGRRPPSRCSGAERRPSPGPRRWSTRGGRRFAATRACGRTARPA